MKKLSICLLGLLLVTCAPVYETYLGKSELNKIQGKTIVSIDTIKSSDGVMLHVKYRD
jgi:hypothetical protein